MSLHSDMDLKNYSARYFKNGCASIIFIVCALLVYYIKDLNKVKIVIISGLILAFCLDFTFTLNPDFHNAIIGYNNSTYITLTAIIIFFMMLFLNRKKVQFR